MRGTSILFVAILSEVAIILVGFGWDLMSPTSAELGPWLMFLGIIVAALCAWVYWVESYKGSALESLVGGNGSIQSGPRFGYPWQSIANDNLIEWSVLVSTNETLERCEVSMYGDGISEPSPGISLRWRTREGNTTTLTLDPHKPYYVPLFARWEPHADKPSNIQGAAIICDDSYYEKHPPFSLVPVRTVRRKYLIELRSTGNEWRSGYYLITVPDIGWTNGTFILIPQVVMQ